MTSEHDASVLKERARRLASVASPAEATVPLHVVAFQLGVEQYAIETVWVQQVCPLKSLTPVPNAARFFIGVTSLRGRIVSVVDLRTFFDLPDTGRSGWNRLVVIAHESIVAGILADQVLAGQSIDGRVLTTNLATHAGIRTQYLRGVTTEGLIVLDAARLMADQRLFGFGSQDV